MRDSGKEFQPHNPPSAIPHAASHPPAVAITQRPRSRIERSATQMTPAEVLYVSRVLFIPRKVCTVLYVVNTMYCYYCTCIQVMYVYTRTWGISKVIFKIFQLPIISRRILAPDVFNYADSKSEIWNRAKKVREVFMYYKSPTFCNEKSCFCRRFYTIKKYFKKL